MSKNSTVANWIQFGILLLAMLGLAMHGEGRLSHLEQGQKDLGDHVATLEQRIDRAFDRSR